MAIGETELSKRFGFHPGTPETGPQHDLVRRLHLELAETLDSFLPDGRDKSTAMTKLQESMHWSNSAIAMTAPLAGDE